LVFVIDYNLHSKEASRALPVKVRTYRQKTES